MDASTETDRSLEPKDLTGGDYGFMALIVVVLIAVTILGVLSFREANKTEGTKRNGEQWAAWFTKASETRFAPDYAIAACAGGAKPAAPPAAAAAGEEAKPADAPAPFASVHTPLPATVDTLLSSVFSTRSRQLCESERNSEVPTSVGEYMLD